MSRNNSTRNKSEFLGMPFGTASGRLRKAIMFRLVQKCNEDICFKCGLRIDNINEFTIEHKLPWENRSVALFLGSG